MWVWFVVDDLSVILDIDSPPAFKQKRAKGIGMTGLSFFVTTHLRCDLYRTRSADSQVSEGKIVIGTNEW